MHRPSLEQELARLSEDMVPPDGNGDNNKDYTWFSNLESQSDTSELHHLIERIYSGSVNTRSRKTDLDRHRQHCRLTVLNLSRTALCNRWLLVPMTTNSYSQDPYIKRMNLSLNHMKDIVHYLNESGLVRLLPGKKYSKQGLRTRIYPSKDLFNQLYKIALGVEEAFEGPYVTINSGEGGYDSVIASLSIDHPDRTRIEVVNRYLSKQQWTLKAPVILKYKNNPFNGGRLYTAFQNLPARKYKIRQNTLINNLPITEVDFSANHLRINLAVLANEDAGDTPYEDIMEIADTTRSVVKTFITIAMGADSQQSAMKASSKEGIDKQLFKTIEAATLKRFPKLSLYTSFGVKAQSLEGQILLDVMVEGIGKDITTIPVHDAVAVNVEHAQWCQDVMTEQWVKHVAKQP